MAALLSYRTCESYYLNNLFRIFDISNETYFLTDFWTLTDLWCGFMNSDQVTEQLNPSYGFDF